MHLLRLLNYREVEESDGRLVMEMDNRPDLANVRAGKRIIVTAVDVIDVGAHRLAARATLSFAVLDRR